MAVQAFLRRLRVVRRHRHHTGTSGLGRLLGELDRHLGVVGAGPGDDLDAVTDGLDRRFEEGDLLDVRQRRRLASRAGDHDSIRAVVGEMFDQSPEGGVVDGAVVVEGGEDRSQDLTEWGIRSLIHGRQGSRDRPFRSVTRAQQFPQGTANEPATPVRDASSGGAYRSVTREPQFPKGTSNERASPVRVGYQPAHR